MFHFNGQRPAIRHGPERVVAQIPEDLLDFVGIHAGLQGISIKRTHNPILRAYLRLLFHEHQRFVHKRANVGLLKLVGLLPGIVEKVGDDVVESLGFSAHNVDKMLLVVFERNEACQLLHCTGHSR